MFEELSEAGSLLRSALERYHNACSAVESYCRKSDLHVATSDRISSELSLLGTFTETLEKPRALIARSQNSSRCLVPVNSLPPEILTHIFGLVVRSEREVCAGSDHVASHWGICTHQPPDLLALVCVQWRNLLLQHPTFWSRINLVHSDLVGWSYIPHAKVWAQRSDPTPLDIHVMIEGSCGDPDEETALTDFLASVANRQLGSLSFTLSCVDDLKETAFLNRYLLNWALGILRKLVIEKSGGGSSFSHHFIRPASIHQFQNLDNLSINLPPEHLEALWKPITSLQLRGVYIDWGSQVYHGLVELCLFMDKKDQSDVPVLLESQLVSILTSSPGLQVIRLGIIVEEDIDLTEEVVTSVQLNHLQVLDLDFVTPNTVGRSLRFFV
ncbi:hypothetical protein RSAG8_04803, partial [Rhizoctonia solani AG-8 WAC10335]